MKKLTYGLLLALIAVVVLAGCGVLQEPEAASGTIEAIPLATQSAGAVVESTDVAPTARVDEATVAANPTAEAAVATEAPVSEPVVFTIDSAASQVRFQLDEDLRGERKTVVGATDQVAGQLSIDLADLSSAQVGVIQINARTLATDSNFRNRAIQNEILDTGDYEFITFTPTGLEGLPAAAAVGETITFSLVGDLTIRDVTLPATFAVEATAVSERQITGTATAIVNRADFGLQIPSVPNVANVEEEVELYIDFTANAS
ncbi:MAG: YceI family protein [Candidatus Promineofilum sp.]|nr:YceI family protein [Promineifilum sp.]